MSPVGKPTDDGAITLGTRHSTRHGNLGALAVWACPACGKQNDGQKVEHGCVHCGAGDQRQGKAGTLAQDDPGLSPVVAPRPPRAQQNGARRAPVAAAPQDQRLRLYRLIEYVFTDPRHVQDTLRRSLVGRIDMGSCAITATLVDSLDAQQEDRLRMARMQPGVWLANPEAMREPVRVGLPVISYAEGAARAVEYFEREHQKDQKERAMPTPEPSPQISSEHQAFAHSIASHYGLKLAYTLALALQTIAEELAGNMESEKFLTQEEALGLARALMAEIPEEWNPQPAETTEEQPDGQA